MENRGDVVEERKKYRRRNAKKNKNKEADKVTLFRLQGTLVRVQGSVSAAFFVDCSHLGTFVSSST
jgi:hypothetical protein